MEVYLALFAGAFLAATLLPGGSEVLLAKLHVDGHDPWLLWAVATLGNTLGSVLNWYLAVGLLRFEERRWFPFRRDRLGKARAWFERWGVWSLLLAWTPVVGDPLTFVAGLMRTPLPRFVLLVGLGKGARYAAVLLLAEGLR